MPSLLPVAHVRPAWMRWGSVVPLLAIATFLTWELPPIAAHTPFMLYFAVAAAVAVFGGVGPAALAVAASLLVVVFDLWPAATRGGPSLINDAVFVVVCGWIIFLSDRATQTARRERALREWSEVSLRSVGDGVIVTDAECRVLAMNAVAEELTGWSESEARENPIAKVFEIVNEQTRATVENPIDRVCREGRVVGLANHTVLLARDGREIPIDDSGAPIWSEDGRVAGTILVFRDIRERRKAERQRAALLEGERAARAEAEAANRAKDEFLAVLSHELRTPLNAVLGWAQVGRTGDRRNDPIRALEVIERNARRQARLIDDVLDVSRIVSGKLSLEFAHLDLGLVVEAAVESVKPLVEDKQIALEVRGDCDGAVLGDAVRLEQVVTNLLSNAVKFTPQGGRVEVVMERQGPMCAVTVRDTGVGIGPDFLPIIFDRFRQEESGTARRFSGLGLGLTIVKHLVELHGGTVSAASAGPHQGSAFTVRLPLSEGRAFATDSRMPTRLAAPELAGIRVLAVDDEPDAREFVAEALRHAGADVRMAGSVEEALEILETFQPNLLVADIEMPGEDGFALLRRVREAGHQMPAIALTAHSSIAGRMRALEEGFRQHVPKPVEVAELLLVVASVIAPDLKGRPS